MFQEVQQDKNSNWNISLCMRAAGIRRVCFLLRETKGHNFVCEADKKQRGEQGVVVLAPTIQGAE